jgi:putative transposase
MPNHAHILLKITHGDNLPYLMKLINQNYTNYYKRTYGITGNLFQGRYKALIVETDGYLLECGRYIERNPLKSGLENDLYQYSFSSFNFYVEGKRDEIITPNPLYLELSRSEKERRSLYAEYVLKERMEDHVKDSNSGVRG